MTDVLIKTALLILCGLAWRHLRPMGLSAGESRRVITALVYALLLPALVLDVLTRTSLGTESIHIALAAAIGVLGSMGLVWLGCRICHIPRPVSGTLLLAAAFPNATYMGLPVLEQTFGPWASRIAIQYDLFACTPLLLTVGVLLARRYGETTDHEPVWHTLLKVPPLWAALLAVTLNLSGVTLPPALHDTLRTLGMGVVPLMLLALGMSLRWDTFHPATLPRLLPVILIQLLVMPLLVWLSAGQLGLGGDTLVATVLEAAMPSMVLGVMLADRYRLDAGLYAAAVSVTTTLSLFTLPLWYDLMR